jgi:undecaprenyl-diphosphatase
MHSIIIFGAKYLFVAIVLAWLLAWYQANGKTRSNLTIATAAALIIAVFLDKIAGGLYYDPRPFVSHHIIPLISHSADNGFPSEHTLFSVALASTLFYYRPKLGVVALIIAILVGSARVAAHVHSPIDIVGGIMLGFAAGSCGYYAVRKWYRPQKPAPLRRGDGRPADPR